MAEGKESDWSTFLGMLAPGPGEKILDIGAGDCSKAARVLQASKGAVLYAIDPNEKRIAAAKRDHPQVESSVGSAESLPYPDSYFDKAYSTMALHHFADPERALVEIARVLKPGGTYTVVEVEPGSSLGRLFRIFGGILGEKMAMRTRAQLTAKLGQGGRFQVVGSASLGSRYIIHLSRA